MSSCRATNAKVFAFGVIFIPLCLVVAVVATQYLDAQRSERLLEQCSHQLTACIAKAPVCR